MFKKTIILCFFLLGVAACQEIISSQEKEEPPHPIIGTWAQAGKCETMPWVFNPYTVKWGQNNGTWKEEKGKIRIRAHIGQDNAVMLIYLTYPQNNRMAISSVDYGESRMHSLKGQLIKCS